jgi:H+-translocating NAD(P) transhydrogenase subunit alpha
MKIIGILKEQNGDPRVCVGAPTAQKIIKDLGFEVLVEKNAGKESGFADEEYTQAGARVLERKEVCEKADILLFINHFRLPTTLPKSKILIGIVNPLFHYNQLMDFMVSEMDLYSLDLLPRTTKAQSMDVLSSMASLSGYKAVIKAAEIHNSVIPMFTTAAGTIKPAKVLVIGAGVAGLQAIATAKRLGAVVEAFDVRTAAGEEVRSLGAKFIEVEGAQENQAAGGYAVEQSEDYLRRQRELIDKHVSEAAIVISTANIPGRRAPLLIEAESVEKMQFGSVIVDLASEQGGNCALTQDEKIIEHNGVKIVGSSFLAREIPTTSSRMLSGNYFNFLKHFKTIEEGEATEDPIVDACRVIQNGKLVNERVKSFINQ